MYYAMECIKYRDGYLRQIGSYPDLVAQTRAWITGQRLTVNVPQPLEFGLDPEVPGDMPVFFKGSKIPLMREDLLKELEALGVDNTDVYDAIVRDPETGKEWKDYKAINVIGLVAAADLAKSEYVATDPPIIDVLFDKLVIDSSRAGDMLLFRLAENLSALMAHEKIKRAIEAQRDRFPHMVFVEPEEWAG